MEEEAKEIAQRVTLAIDLLGKHREKIEKYAMFGKVALQIAGGATQAEKHLSVSSMVDRTVAFLDALETAPQSSERPRWA